MSQTQQNKQMPGFHFLKSHLPMSNSFLNLKTVSNSPARIIRGVKISFSWLNLSSRALAVECTSFASLLRNETRLKLTNLIELVIVRIYTLRNILLLY